MPNVLLRRKPGVAPMSKVFDPSQTKGYSLIFSADYLEYLDLAGVWQPAIIWDAQYDALQPSIEIAVVTNTIILTPSCWDILNQNSWGYLDPVTTPFQGNADAGAVVVAGFYT